MDNKEQKTIKTITYAVPLTAIGLLILATMTYGTQAVSEFLGSGLGMTLILLVAGAGVLMRFFNTPPKR